MVETNLTSYGAGSYSHQSESLHGALYSLHDAIYFKGGDAIKRALAALHEIERNNADLRPVAKQYIGEFEKLRGQLESVGQNAARLRSRLIRENGCNGECK